mmetsp:Transcript_11295/g.17033  ORF Transcript_11295/g.17033 Transcript_11295/m.17033 type:complete len:354 (-) Transcript_11295:1569-2630(-)
MLEGSDLTITLDLFVVSLLLASLLFLFCLVLAKRKYSFLKRVNPNFDLKKLLILSAATVCFLRVMSFIGVIAMDLANVRAHYSLKPASSHAERDTAKNVHPIEKNQAFYDSSMTVLFDLPNAIVISTYVLLTLVWAECSLLSRFHTESTAQWRKRGLLLFLIFNTSLYATQIILYILIFLGGVESEQVVIVRNVVNVAMAVINLSAVCLVALLYIYLNVSFSGFPYRSQNSKESLRKISNVMLFWSLSRIVWGVAMLLAWIHDIDLLTSQGGWSLVLFVLLLFCEIVPIIALMDYNRIIFDFERGATRAMSSLATGHHVLGTLQFDESDEELNAGDSFRRTSEEPLLSSGSIS